MSAPRLGDYLGHMLKAVALACSYVEGMIKESFTDTTTSILIRFGRQFSLRSPNSINS